MKRPPPLEPWILRLAERNDRRAMKAVGDIVALGPRGFAILEALATSCDRPVILRWVMDGLGHYRSRAAEALLRKSLRSPHMTVRLHALCAVDRLGTPALVRAVRPLVRDKSGGIRINALALLIRRRVRGLDLLLKAALRDPKPYVRVLAAKTLAAKKD
ncbi:MAG: HEAT repeat domain-containing protein [Planctomycetes bacterium]|nr:HEAT repeat domain-containing protein [Planctomycetota bacterium]